MHCKGVCAEGIVIVSRSEVWCKSACDLGSVQVSCCEGYFEGTLGQGDAKVKADIWVTKAMRR